MVKILDRYGRPIDTGKLRERQTATLRSLHETFAGHPSRGLTPPKLARILEDAERGSLVAQSDLFEDMEEKDAHIFAEMQKRKNALLTISWDIVPPENPSAQEKTQAEATKELIKAIPDFEDIILDAADAIGKGFSAQEIEWQLIGKTWLPKRLCWRPQSWFQLATYDQNEIRLRDNSADGAELQPFGWVVHRHKAKSGYVSRAGLHRVLSWPYLFKNYSVRDLAEFLEIYGLPLRLGKYPSGANDQEKATLLRAVIGIGHNAAGIIPSGMEIEFEEAAKGQHDPFVAMISWCERSESKAILGATLTAQTDEGSGAYALGDVHNEVRHDIRDSDARQTAGTLTRDLVFPIAVLNIPGITSAARAPRLVFDCEEAEDLKLYSDALPKLVGMGLRVPAKFVYEKLRIPQPLDDDEILRPATQPVTTAPGEAALTALLSRESLDDARAINREIQEQIAQGAESIAGEWQKLLGKRLEDIVSLLEETGDLSLFRQRLDELLHMEPTTEVVEALARAGFAAHIVGRSRQR